MQRLDIYRLLGSPTILTLPLVMAMPIYSWATPAGNWLASPICWLALLLAALLADNLGLRYRHGQQQHQQHLDGELLGALEERLHHREQELARCQLLLRMQQEATPDGVAAFDKVGNLVSCNQRFRSIWRIPDALLALGLQGPIRDTLLAQVTTRENLETATLDTQTDPWLEIHDEIHTLDGRVLDHHSHGLNDNLGNHHGRVWLYRDITDTRKTEAHLRRLANEDVLTGIANRRFFMEQARQCLQAMARQPGSVALLLLDLDHFKGINDRWGHPAGDRVLEHFAGVVQSVLGETDLFGRLGGEEFAVLLDNTHPGEALAMARELTEAVRATPACWDGQSIAFSVSIGLSLPIIGDDLGALLRRADLALYRAKASGRDRVAVSSHQNCRAVAP